jgi:arylsulfatase A
MVFMDDMGYGDLSSYGHPTIKTPHLDAMADRGIRFTSFYAPAAVCTPSRSGLLTGKYPVRNARRNFGPESKTGLLLSETTIAEVLKGKGYKTAAIGKWHLGHQTEYLPTSRGFDSFYGLPYSNDMILPWCPWLTEEDKLFLYQDELPTEEIGKNQKDMMLAYHEKASEFIKASNGSPFFLYLAHSMPHLPISAPDRFRGTSVAGLYGDVIETIDHTIGELFALLESEGIANNTMVVFTSDNGPWHNLPDRMLQDGVQPWHTGSTGVLRGAKMTSYEGGFRVPALITWPNKIEPNQVNAEIVSAIDLYPTFAAMGGFSDSDLTSNDGYNLLPFLTTNSASPRSTFVYSMGGTLEGIRDGKWKLRLTKDGVELYNLDTDPSESYNRVTTEDEIVQRLLTQLKESAIAMDATIAQVE